MTPREVFGVAVRVIGLLIVLAALIYLASAVILFFDPHYRAGAHPPMHYLLTGLAFLLLGLYLLRGASHVARFAYPERDTRDDGIPKV